MNIKVRSIGDDFVVIHSHNKASIEKHDDDLYERLDRDYNQFSGCKLISCHEFDGDWPTWEIHPKGDEVVVLLSGKVTFVLQEGKSEKSVLLDKQGDYIVVPENTCQTARTSTKTKVLFVTPGEGTRNKVVTTTP